MKIPHNAFKRAILSGKHQLGMWSALSSHLSVELLSLCGFDWLMLDTEHAPNELPMVVQQLQGGKGGTAEMVVRPAWNDMVTIKRLLDQGAQTLLLPFIETAEQAEAAVSYCRYPPHGVRGYAAGTRAFLYGHAKDYHLHYEAEQCILLQVESVKGVENIEKIAAVKGVDGIFVGPGDLSASMGYLSESEHPKVVETISQAIRRIVAAGKAAGTVTTNMDHARRFMRDGSTFTAVGVDSQLLRLGANRLVQEFADHQKADA